jgi:beta-glucanase (GH16 family)
VRRLRKLALVAAAAVAVFCSAGLTGGSRSVAPAAYAATASSAGQQHTSSLPAAPTPKGKPAFDATFTGTSLNTKVWDTCYPLQPSYGGGCKNWGNSEEAEWYLPSQVAVYDGELHLVARRARTAGYTYYGKRFIYGCRSGMVTSWPSFKFEYGFVQIVAEIPHAPGLWPALWLAATNGKYPPEMDILESWGVKRQTGAFFHPLDGPRVIRTLLNPDVTRGWKVYSLSWTKSKLVYYVGKTAVLTINDYIPHQKMYFLADLAEYVQPRAGYCSGQLRIKSVKIWKY